METELSRLTTKYQATIPAKVRQTLGVQKGDAVRFCIERGRVTLEKAQTKDMAFARFIQDTLEEWDSPEDDEAFKGL